MPPCSNCCWAHWRHSNSCFFSTEAATAQLWKKGVVVGVVWHTRSHNHTHSHSTHTRRRVKMTRLRMRVAERLKGAQNTYAMLSTFNEVDMSSIIDLRNQYKVRCVCIRYADVCMSDCAYTHACILYIPVYNFAAHLH